MTLALKHSLVFTLMLSRDKKLERQTVSRDHKFKKQINVFVISQIYIS